MYLAPACEDSTGRLYVSYLSQVEINDTLNLLHGEIYLDVQPLTLSLTPQTLLMKVGETETLTADFSGIKASDTAHFETVIANYQAESDSEADVIDFDAATGTVTALNPGTAIVQVSVVVTYMNSGEEAAIKLGSVDFRVDVAADASSVTGVSLVDTKASVNLKSTDHPTFRILPEMEQLQHVTDNGAPVSESEEPTAGIVTHAEFVSESMADNFRLEIVDSRTLKIVPLNTSLKAGTCKSAVRVTIDGQEFTTKQVLTLTVTSKLPTVKAAAVKLNSYLLGESAALTFTGAEVESIEVVSKPDWLSVDEENMTVCEEIGYDLAKASGKLVLSCTLAGYTEAVKVTASVSLALTMPSVKMSAKSITLSNMVSQSDLALKVTPAVFADPEAFPGAVEMITEKVGKVTSTYTPAGNGNGDYTFDELGFDVCLYPVSRMDYAPDAIKNYDYDLSVSYFPRDPDDTATHHYTLYLEVGGKEITVPITVKPVKTISVSVKAAGALDKTVPSSEVTLNVTAKNLYGGYSQFYGSSAWKLVIDGITGTKKGCETLSWTDDSAEDCPFTWDDVYIGLKSDKLDAVPSGYTWTVKGHVDYAPYWTTDDSDDEEQIDPTPAVIDPDDETNYARSKEFSLKFTVKTPAKATQVQVSYKAAGKMDLYGTTGITFTPVIKGATLDYGFKPEDNFTIMRVYDGASGKVLEDTEENNVTDWFDCKYTAGSGYGDYVYTFTLNEYGLSQVNAKDKFTFVSPLLDEDYNEISGDNVTCKPYTFTLTASKIKVSAPKSVTLLKKDAYSSAAFDISVVSGQNVSSVALDANSAKYFSLIQKSDGSFTLMALQSVPVSKIPKTVKIGLWCEGNNTAKASATVSITVNLK